MSRSEELSFNDERFSWSGILPRPSSEARKGSAKGERAEPRGMFRESEGASGPLVQVPSTLWSLNISFVF